MKKLLFTLTALALTTAAYAQNLPSGSPRTQGVPDGYGDPVQVTVVSANGSDVTGTTANQVQGNGAAAATDIGNPVKAGAIYQSSLPTYTNNQRTNLHADTRGNLRVTLSTTDSSAALYTDADNADAVASSAGFTRMGTISRMYGYNGTTFDRVRADTNALAVQPALTSNFWNYAAATAGIVNTTTAVTIKAAAGSGVRNYLCSLQVSHDTLGAVTNLAIRDGAGGTTLWLGRLQTVATDASGGAGTIALTPCLRGTANTLLEVVTLTAVTGAVFVSAQGFTGS